MARKDKKSKYGSTRDRRRKQREEDGEFTGGPYINKDVSGATKWFRQQEGTNNIRIMPFEVNQPNDYADKGELYWQKKIDIVYNLGPKEQAICLTPDDAKKFKKYINGQIRDGVLTDEEAKQFYVKSRYIYNVQNLDDKDDPEAIRLWEISYYLFQKQLDKELDENEDYDAYVDLTDGFFLKLRFDEEELGKSATFLKTARIDFKPADDLDDDIVDQCIDLDELMIYTSYDDAIDLLNNCEPSEKSDDDDDEEPKREKKKKTRKKAEEEEDEDEQEEETEEAEDEVEEEAEEVEEDEDEDAQSFTKDDIEVGGKIWIHEDGEDYEGEITSLPKRGKNVLVKFEGEDDDETIEVDEITKYEAPKKEKATRSTRRKKK